MHEIFCNTKLKQVPPQTSRHGALGYYKYPQTIDVIVIQLMGDQMTALAYE